MRHANSKGEMASALFCVQYGGAKVGLQCWVRETEAILILSFIYHCILFFHMNRSKPTFPPLCISSKSLVIEISFLVTLPRIDPLPPAC